MTEPEPTYVRQTVATALLEDVGSGDLTAQLIPADRVARSSVITREDAVKEIERRFREFVEIFEGKK